MNRELWNLVRVIPDWLAFAGGHEISVGLSRQEALRRAGILSDLLRAGDVDPASVVLDEDLKDVFHALVATVTARADLEETSGAYQFLARVKWADDCFEEWRDLLWQLAASGWRCVGLSLAELEKRRSSLLADLNSMMLKNPRRVAELAIHAYETALQRWSAPRPVDENQWFLGEAALLAANAVRYLGRRDEAELWLSRAHAAFRITLNPEPALSRVRYGKCALLFDKGRIAEVLEVLPSLLESFERFGMSADVTKTRLFLGVALKALGRNAEATSQLEALASELTVELGLRGLALPHLGARAQRADRPDDALRACEEALRLLQPGGHAMALADLRMIVAATYRSLGRLEESVAAYRASREAFDELGMIAIQAYVRVLTAETLLALDRLSDVEAEILQALPIIEEQKMVPEGLAAIALLREAVRRRNADPLALRELREFLPKQK